jgi:hypothetical protein
VSLYGAFPALAVAAPSLDPARAATLAALVETLGGLPYSLVDAAGATGFTNRVKNGYPGLEARARSSIDASLDLLERGNEPGWFAGLGAARRLDTLRALLASSSKSPPEASLARQLIQGVAVDFYPDHRAGPVPLVI